MEQSKWPRRTSSLLSVWSHTSVLPIFWLHSEGIGAAFWPGILRQCNTTLYLVEKIMAKPVTVAHKHRQCHDRRPLVSNPCFARGNYLLADGRQVLLDEACILFQERCHISSQVRFSSYQPPSGSRGGRVSFDAARQQHATSPLRSSARRRFLHVCHPCMRSTYILCSHLPFPEDLSYWIRVFSFGLFVSAMRSTAVDWRGPRSWSSRAPFPISAVSIGRFSTKC